MAEIDAVLDGIIVAMAKGTMEVLPLLPMVSSKSKGDYILAMGKEGLSPELIQELEKLMDRVRTAHVLRDDGPFNRVQCPGSCYGSGRSRDWLKMKNVGVPAVKREAEEDWGKGGDRT